MEDSIPLKLCCRRSQCVHPDGPSLPATAKYFHRNKTCKDGFCRSCKECNRSHVREWNAKNSARHTQRAMQWNRANREKSRAFIKRWKKRNKVKQSQYWSSYYLRHGERVRARKASERGRMIGRLFAARRRARQIANGGNYAEADIKRQFSAQSGKCYYCHAEFNPVYHIEHVVPLVRGGSNSPENIVLACPKCNRAKGSKLPHEWPEGGRLL